MGYCNSINVQYLMAQSLSTATNDTPASASPGWLINIGRELDRNLITEDSINQWIIWAGSQVDGILGTMYNVPFCQQADYETVLYADISEYNPYLILEAGCPFGVGDEIVLIEDDVEEKHTIAESLGNGVFETLSAILYNFTTEARVLRVKYPDPINLIATRLTAANLYEKYFAAETSPQQSQYGELQKKLAKSDLNNILNGRIVLHGEHRIGDRFKNGNIRGRYHLMTGDGIDQNTSIEDI